MIFITLGTQKFQLNRLLKQVDELIEAGLMDEEVIAQVGNSDYKPRHFKYFPFLDKKDFDEFIQKSSIIITHSGVGTIITALNQKKPVIVYPRLEKYKEHVDDHQLDIARAFAKKGYVLCCNETDSLVELIQKSKTFPFQEYVSQRQKIIKLIEDFLVSDTSIQMQHSGLESKESFKKEPANWD